MKKYKTEKEEFLLNVILEWEKKLMKDKGR